MAGQLADSSSMSTPRGNILCLLHCGAAVRISLNCAPGALLMPKGSLRQCVTLGGFLRMRTGLVRDYILDWESSSAGKYLEVEFEPQKSDKK